MHCRFVTESAPAIPKASDVLVGHLLKQSGLLLSKRLEGFAGLVELIESVLDCLARRAISTIWVHRGTRIALDRDADESIDEWLARISAKTLAKRDVHLQCGVGRI